MEKGKLIILVTISGLIISIGMLVLIISIVRNARQKVFIIKTNHELEKMAAVVQAQEQERAKIARNLHDEVGSVLAMTNRQLKGVVSQLSGTEKYGNDIAFAIEMLGQTTDKIRTISHEMLPHYLIKFGLPKTLERLLLQTEKSLGEPCKFEATFDDTLYMSQQQQVNFYAIVMEIMNNLLKHARPHSVSFQLSHTEKSIRLKVIHDGVAISQSDYEYLLNQGDGMGLESITIRLKMINGELLYYRNSPGGTIELTMPKLEKEDSDEKIDL